MAIDFFQQRKKQKYLTFVIIFIILLTLIILWKGFLLKPKIPLKIFQPKKIEINFEVLKNPILQGLQPLEEIPPFEEMALPEEKIGRENPFAPY